MQTTMIYRAGAACAASMAALYVVVPGWTEAHPALFMPVLIAGAIWTARHTDGDGD